MWSQGAGGWISQQLSECGFWKGGGLEVENAAESKGRSQLRAYVRRRNLQAMGLLEGKSNGSLEQWVGNSYAIYRESKVLSSFCELGG